MARVMLPPEKIKEDMLVWVAGEQGHEGLVLVRHPPENGRFRGQPCDDRGRPIPGPPNYEFSLEAYRGVFRYDPAFKAWANGRIAAADHFPAFIAWEASRKAFLEQKSESMEEEVARAILQGRKGELGVLVDWMADNGRLDETLTTRLKEVETLLAKCLPYIGGRGPAAMQTAKEIRETLRVREEVSKTLLRAEFVVDECLAQEGNLP